MAILNFLKKKKTKKESFVAKVPPVEQADKEGKEEKEEIKASEPAVSKESMVKKEKSLTTKETIPSGKGAYSHVLLQPRITEKATELAERNIYTFDIDRRATKPEVRKAIKEIYNVTPVKIRIVPVPPKMISVRGRRGKFGVKSGSKKAMVYLRKGETIEFI